MVRNVIGSVLALAGATAAVWSPFRAWYDGRHGSEYRIQDLFGGITDVKADVIGSILLPFAFAAVVTLVGVVFRSRLLVALAGLTVLGFTVLWMVRVGQVEGGLTVGGDGTGLGDGVASALGGGALLLLASLVMSGRRTRSRSLPLDGPRHRRTEPAEPTDPTRPGEPVDPDRPTQPTYPTPDDPYGAPPTRTMDVPPWDQNREPPPNHRA
ncbi:hypothetical protein M5362_24740 [Streptomyces sp. Je 1-79]|uniref:hypothetical protein n=1 Tax=Streptomyces sp. Je 1-79 TaxID=2943847 RepID=UPI0021A3EA28|nr:hypothetical protein [Streptomyces sp. Je 1-79]MCT4356340.1 hypothetical protein [Streptomyces sp. Je 1-79]